MESKQTFQTNRLLTPNLRAPNWIQSDFAESLKEDEAEAIIDHASENIRIYRRGELPAIGKTAAKKILADENAETTRAPLGAGTR